MKQISITNNNIIFFSIVSVVALFFLLHDKFFQYEDDKGFVSEFLRTSKYSDSKHIIAAESARKIIRQKSDTAIKAIKFRNFTLLEKLIHPKFGIRFSPYIYVMSSDVVFSAENFETRYYDDYIYDWGSKRMSKNMRMTFKDYYSTYIYQNDYAISQDVTYNQPLPIDNIVDNTYNFYPEAIVVEYNSDNLGDYSKSLLRLVFEKYKNEYFLSGIITINDKL